MFNLRNQLYYERLKTQNAETSLPVSASPCLRVLTHVLKNPRCAHAAAEDAKPASRALAPQLDAIRRAALARLFSLRSFSQPENVNDLFNAFKFRITCHNGGIQFLRQRNRKSIGVGNGVPGFDPRCRQDSLFGDAYKRDWKPAHICKAARGFFAAAFALSRVHQFAQVDDTQVDLRVLNAALQ